MLRPRFLPTVAKTGDGNRGEAGRKACSNERSDEASDELNPVAATRSAKGVFARVQCSTAAWAGLGGKAGLVSVPRISASAVCSEEGSFSDTL